MSEIQTIQPTPEVANWGESPSREQCCIGCRWSLFKDPIEQIRVWKCECGMQRAVGVPKCPRIIEIQEEYNPDLRMTIKKEIFCESEKRELLEIERKLPHETSLMFLRCRRLSIWTWRDFCCKYFKPRYRKPQKRGDCAYAIAGEQYSHPKNCGTCLLNPETCRRSPYYNLNWDLERGEWKKNPKDTMEGAS